VCKGHVCKGARKIKDACENRQTCHSGRWYIDTKKQPYPRMWRTSDRMARKTIRLEIER
jgi:hypothetical protein